MPVPDLVRKKLADLPHRPGVYLMKDRFGTVIYVGKARDLRKRVMTYFQPSRRLGWDPRFKALTETIHDLDVHVVRSEPEALLLESKLIKELQPKFNVDWRDDKRFLMVKVNLNDPIPRFTLTRLRTDDGSRYYGPFPNAGALRNTLTLMRRQFNLRGCRPLTPGPQDYKHCLYGNLKWCTAPCVGNVTPAQYLDQVRAACEFLDGQCGEMAAQLEAEMRKAAAAQEYEKAANLRDALAALKQTTAKATRYERTPWNVPVAAMPERDNAELAKALGLPAPPARIEGFDISNISGTLKVASVVTFRNGRPDRASYRRLRIKDVQGQDDFACIAEAVRRRYARLLKEQAKAAAPPAASGGAADGQSMDTPDPDADRAIVEELRELMANPFEALEQLKAHEPPPTAHRSASASPATTLPDLIVIDGGKGQLSAACAELRKLGLGHIPVIGLAKEFEEIHRPGVAAPLRLSHDSNALKLLQRIRDESHRVANSYNAQLRLRKISESLLDEFPGIGEARKAALLKKFGSIQRLRLATEEQIAEVPGFGGKVAAELKAFLLARLNAPAD
ncbi:MAG: excinuclease ABC subunit UvrC [Limisphaerales bacterium]